MNHVPGTREDMSRIYLKYLKVERFGALSNLTVGPLGPGLNVVFGRNEAGKSTLFSFVDGVLFGWREARGARNTYKPVGAERAGSLLFAEAGSADEGAADDEVREYELWRVRNADGVQGNIELLDDLDAETFHTMFALTSDELRSLHNTTDVTAKLLTAGSGTGSSPAQALAIVQWRLAECTSKAAGARHSVVRLSAERDEAKRALDAVGAEMELYRKHHHELHDLQKERDDLAARMQQNDHALDNLALCREGLVRLAREEKELLAELSELEEEERAAQERRQASADSIGERLASLTSSEDRVIRDRLDALDAREGKYVQAVDTARGNLNDSKALYETYKEALGTNVEEEHARTRHKIRATFSIVIPLMFVLVGVPLFMYGRHLGSLSCTILGLALVAFAVVVAAAALGMMLRPERTADPMKTRIEDAQWVMVQDGKKLEACQADEAQFVARVAEELEGYGLGDAQGDIRRARVILDGAKDVRAAMALDEQRAQAARSRMHAVATRLDAIAQERFHLCERASVPETVSDKEMEAAIDRCVQLRLGLQETANALSKRHGELSQELSQAQQAHEFDRLKTTYQQAVTRTEEAKHEFAKLLLARRMLEVAIASWESKSQPEVYAQASRLFALMTDGAWTSVFLSGDGALKVADDAHTVRDPLLLSLGTSQQLYLALRIALLMNASSVGRAVPILADDILVHFDAVRRVGAARALAELARVRQIILFTCHEEVVAALTGVDPSATIIEL